MTRSASTPLVAIDVGNSRVKFGWFDDLSPETLPAPTDTLELPSGDDNTPALLQWLDRHPSRPATWAIASVNRPVSESLQTWVGKQIPEARLAEIALGDLSLSIAVDQPQRTGIDRLLGAVAANVLRQPDRPAIVLDVGSAITVDLVTADGTFAGGAILPGIAMSARALHEQTDLLPLDPRDRLTAPPPPLGTSTESAIHSGLFWGAVGAMRELVARLSAELPDQPELFLTGGAAPDVAQLLGTETRYEPHLVLGGLAHTLACPGRKES